MKTEPFLNKQNMLALVVTISAFTGLVTNDSFAQKEPDRGPVPTARTQPLTVAAEKKLMAQAIESSIVLRHGQAFPIVAKGGGSDTNATGGASCVLYDTQTFTHGAQTDLEGAMHKPASYSLPDPPSNGVAIYSPPNADWVIQSFHLVVTDAGSPYEARVQAFPPGYSLLHAGNYSSVKNTLFSFVESLDIPDVVKADITAKVNLMISNVSSYTVQIGGTNGTVELDAAVHGTGVANVQTGHAWYHAYIDGTLTCAPAYLHDQAALTMRLKSWVSGVVRKYHVLHDHLSSPSPN